MKIVSKDQFNHTQLTSQKTGEEYSLSEVVSQLLGSKQLYAVIKCPLEYGGTPFINKNKNEMVDFSA